MRKALVILLLIALAAPAPAAVYRCRDKRGVLVLTDDPDNFPPGCRPEGKQGETVTPPGGTTPSQVPAPERDIQRGDREAPSGGAVSGSGGVPPGLNRPNRSRLNEEDPENGGATPQNSGSAGTSAQGLTAGPELERWMEEARALRREHLEAQTGPPPGPGTPDRQREIENRIDAFLGRLDGSPLSPQERAAVEGELPPPQR